MTDHEGMSSLEFGSSVTHCQLAMASSNSSVQTTSATFSFPTCLQNLSVCVFNITRSCYKLASMCAHQNVHHVSMKTGKHFTLLNHSSSWVCVWIMCGICVKDICEGQRLWHLWVQVHSGVAGWKCRRNWEKKNAWTTEDIKILAHHGERWQGCTSAPHLCVIWQYHSDQILLFCAQLQVTHGRGASELRNAAHRDNHFWGYTKTSMTRRWWEVTLLDSALQLHPALGPHHRNDVDLLEWIQRRPTEVIRWMESLLDEERMRELGCFAWRRESSREILSRPLRIWRDTRHL